MKKLKRAYTEHRVFVILMSLVIICFVLIGTVLFQCFYVGGNKDKYGDRLEGIEKVPIDTKDIQSKLLTEEIVKKATVKVTGKIVYFELKFNHPTTLDEAKSVALKSQDYFKDNAKKFYDFHYTLKEEKTEESDGFLVSGAKNRNGSGLVWNNNNPVVVEEEQSEGNGE